MYNIYGSKNNSKKLIRFHIHPNYQTLNNSFDNLKNEIAIVETEPFSFSQEGILPGCLFEEKLYSSFQNEFVSSGYRPAPKKKALLIDTAVNLKSKKKIKILFNCAKMYKSSFNQTNCEFDEKSFICVSNPLSKFCFGDQGTPLHYEQDNKLYIIGISTYFMIVSGKFCSSGKTNVYIHINQHLKWIRNVIGDSKICISKTLTMDRKEIYYFLTILELSMLCIYLLVYFITQPN